MAEIPRGAADGPRFARLFVEPDAKSATLLAQIAFAARVHHMGMFGVAFVNFGCFFGDQILVLHWMQGQIHACHSANFACPQAACIDQVFSDPQVLHREMVVEIPHPTAGKVKLAGFPYKLSRTPAAITRHPPLLGEDTEAVLRDMLGYSAEAIAEIRGETGK